MRNIFETPMERRVLQIVLLHGGQVNANEIAQEARISWNTAEKHLTTLKRKGLLTVSKIGKNKYYRAKTLF